MKRELTEYTVGKPYNPKRLVWPESSQFVCFDGATDLLLFFNNPTPKEIEAVRKGTARFALLPYKATLFLLHKFGDMSWNDSAFTIWLQDKDEPTIPPEPPTPESRFNLRVFLVGSTDGILHAMRCLSFSPGFSRQLHDMLEKQLQVGWVGDAGYDVGIKEAYARWPSSSAMARDAHVECKGGE
jgi:hypothetical protein